MTDRSRRSPPRLIDPPASLQDLPPPLRGVPIRLRGLPPAPRHGPLSSSDGTELPHAPPPAEMGANSQLREATASPIDSEMALRTAPPPPRRANPP